MPWMTRSASSCVALKVRFLLSAIREAHLSVLVQQHIVQPAGGHVCVAIPPVISVIIRTLSLVSAAAPGAATTSQSTVVTASRKNTRGSCCMTQHQCFVSFSHILTVSLKLAVLLFNP
jgi:hypothetical protein